MYERFGIFLNITFLLSQDPFAGREGFVSDIQDFNAGLSYKIDKVPMSLILTSQSLRSIGGTSLSVIVCKAGIHLSDMVNKIALFHPWHGKTPISMLREHFYFLDKVGLLYL
jgi:hypothetical protein